MARGQSKQGKQSVSFRFDPITVKRLKDRAADGDAGQTALAERYIEEGIRSDEHPLIYFREGAAGRRPALLGTRPTVRSFAAWPPRSGRWLQTTCSTSSRSTIACRAGGEEHYGMVFTSDATMPRNKASIPLWVKTLKKLLEASPADDALRNRVRHLPA